MTPSTRRMKPVAAIERWLYRVDGADYGPVSTDELLDAMLARKVTLETQVCSLMSRKWGRASDHALLRDFHHKCEQRWRAEAFDTEADNQVRRLAKARQRRRRFWYAVAAAVVVAIGFGGWVVWRLGQAQPLGLDKLARLPNLGRLVVADVVEREPPRVPIVAGTPVARLGEPETYDTAGVALEGEATAESKVTRMAFTEDGRVVGISKVELDGVLESAKANLHGCARAAASKDAGFHGTRVGFTVSPGRLTGMTVGDEVKNNGAFKACVKAALSRVPVPMYEGGDRRVTIPIKIGR